MPHAHHNGARERAGCRPQVSVRLAIVPVKASVRAEQRNARQGLADRGALR